MTSSRAKYPLAIVSKILEVLDDKPCGAYNIGCSFLSTIMNSSLADSFKRKNGTMCVNAFHGYSHNYACQAIFHPSRMIGMGIEDFETMERIFSSSNQLAGITRHMSAYRRRMYIDQFFKQWDEDKYVNLGVMLYNNYVQALRIIETESTTLAEAMRSLAITDDDINRWEKEECQYIQTIGQETPWDVHAMAYVESLQELNRLEYVVQYSLVFC